MKTNTLLLSGRSISIFSSGPEGPVFLYALDKTHEEDILKIIEEVSKLTGNRPFHLVTYEIKNWSDELTPWFAKSIFKGDDFKGDGASLLDWIIHDLLSYLKSKHPEFTSCYLCGYSLAGLFSLWSMYQSDLFDGAVCGSSSLWYEGWIEYAQSHTVLSKSRIYLSLGDKEELSRNKMMALVGDNTRKQAELLREDPNVISSVLEMNPGGHFNDIEKRIAKGISWIINNI